MALTLNSNFVAAYRQAAVEPRFLARLWYAATANWLIVDGVLDDASGAGIPISLRSVSQLSRAIDVWTRKLSVEGVELTLARDAFTDAAVFGFPLAGSRCEVLLGERSLATSDFEPYFAGIVEDVITSPEGVTLSVKTAPNKLRDGQFTGHFANVHPLEALETLLLASDVNADLIDSASLAYDVDLTRSHWVVDRSNATVDSERAITTPTKIGELVDEVTTMLQGTLFTAEDGRITFRSLNTATAAVATWTVDDVSDVRVKSLYSDRLNQVVCVAHAIPRPRTKELNDDYEQTYFRDDSAAQARFGYFNAGGVTPTVHSRRVDFPWVSGAGYVSLGFGNPTPGDLRTLKFSSIGGYGICGTRFPGFPAGTQPVNSTLTGSRLLYMQVNDEIVSFDQVTIPTTLKDEVFLFDIVGGTAPFFTTKTIVPFEGYFQVLGRGLFGTTAVDHGQGPVTLFDITVPLDVATAQLDRFANGAPIVTCRTSMRHYDVQVADYVHLDLPGELVRWYQHFGVDSAVKWEVTRKQVDLESDTPGINWELVFATDTGAPAPTIANLAVKRRARNLANRAQASLEGDDVVVKSVVDGFELTTSPAFLIATLGPGSAAGAGSRGELASSASLVIDASSDNFLSFDCSSGSVAVQALSLGSATPVLPPRHVMLYRVSTDGSGTTAVFDFRSRTSFSADRLASAVRAESKALNENSAFSDWFRG